MKAARISGTENYAEEAPEQEPASRCKRQVQRARARSSSSSDERPSPPLNDQRIRPHGRVQYSERRLATPEERQLSTAVDLAARPLLKTPTYWRSPQPQKKSSTMPS